MKRTLIIAEAGVNHNGSLNVAKKLAISAKEAGADIVKYQTFNPDALSSKYAEMAQYQKKNMGQTKSQKEMLSRLTLTHDEFIQLARFCDEIGIKFLSTPFDIQSIDFLNELGCDIWKIPSGEITNYPYLVHIAETKKKIIMSTGMSTLTEVVSALDILRSNGATDIQL